MIFGRYARLCFIAVTTVVTCLGCDSGGYTEYTECYTPLVLSFDGSAVEYLANRGDTYFDVGQQDHSLTTDWPTAKTPWLARDLDGDGRIVDGSELFGSATRLPDGGKAVDGLQALSALDSDGDGRVGESDAEWKSVLVWRDLNANRRAGEGEIEAASVGGLLWIGLPEARRPSKGDVDLARSSPPEPRCDANGNCEVERAEFAYLDDTGEERRGVVVDIHLRTFPRGVSEQGSTFDDPPVPECQ